MVAQWCAWPVALLLAGCATPDHTQPAPETCPELEAGPFDCMDWRMDLVEVTPNLPTIQDGWSCQIDHDDDFPDQYWRLWSHLDGRLAYSWYSPLPPGGESFMALQLDEPGGKRAWAFPAQERGFAIFPETPRGTEGEAGFTFLRFDMAIQQDGAWQRPEDAVLHKGTMGGDWYFAWSWTEAGDQQTLDIMKPSDNGLGGSYSAADQLIRDGDRIVSADVYGQGVGFQGQYWGPTSTAVDCPEQTLTGEDG